MERRREICVLAAELAESNDWQKTTLAIKGLQEEWKTSRMAPDAKNKNCISSFARPVIVFLRDARSTTRARMQNGASISSPRKGCAKKQNSWRQHPRSITQGDSSTSSPNGKRSARRPGTKKKPFGNVSEPAATLIFSGSPPSSSRISSARKNSARRLKGSWPRPHRTTGKRSPPD